VSDLRWPRGAEVKAKKVKKKKAQESSSTYFQNLRPRFLDWEPPTEEEKALEVKARKEAREAELKRVTELAKDRDAEKEAARRRYRSEAARNKQRERG
jgi:hypothetical protein